MTSINSKWQDPDKTDIDFIVVGSGAGGAPLAARLAERGFRVLVAEMGPKKPPAPAGAIVEPTEVPLLHSETTEDKRHSLRYFVKHFGGENEQRNKRFHTFDSGEHEARNPEDEEGIFYPRSQGVGGCTIHNAMITICGPSEDWDEIAEATGDTSWRGEQMRSYFERIENCTYDSGGRSTRWEKLKSLFRSRLSWDTGRHGHGGWLQTSMSDLRLLLQDKKFLKVVLNSATSAFRTGVDSLVELYSGTFAQLDPNHWETMRRSTEGLTRIPCAITENGERSSPRERLLGVQKCHPDRLHLLTGVLVTQVLLDSEPSESTTGEKPKKRSKRSKSAPRAIGVQVLPREHVYEADPSSSVPEDWQDSLQSLYCKREVILCGGSFNTPQLLMLSGIGPVDHLNAKGVDPVVELEKVGQFLQDRYEVPIVATLTDRFRSLDELEFSSKREDPELRKWREGRGQRSGKNIYATNGGIIGIFKRSTEEEVVPDLFMFAVAGYFGGYKVGWSKPSEIAPDCSGEAGEVQNGASNHKRSLTWLILKARSRNDSGTVALHSNEPFRRPDINFNVLPNGPEGEQDIEAICQGVDFIKSVLCEGKKNGLIESFEFPYLENDESENNVSRDDLKNWIREVTWGHHACGTCRMGNNSSDSVVNHRFQVHGVHGLRVVDASVFPRIPGYFIVTNVYMISEKAADILSEDYRDVVDAVLGDKTIKDYLQRDPIFSSSQESQARACYPLAMEEIEARLIRKRREKTENV